MFIWVGLLVLTFALICRTSASLSGVALKEAAVESELSWMEFWRFVPPRPFCPTERTFRAALNETGGPPA